MELQGLGTGKKIPFCQDGTEGLHSIKQLWLNLAVLFAKILNRRFSCILPLNLCELPFLNLSRDGGT